MSRTATATSPARSDEATMTRVDVLVQRRTRPRPAVAARAPGRVRGSRYFRS